MKDLKYSLKRSELRLSVLCVSICVVLSAISAQEQLDSDYDFNLNNPSITSNELHLPVSWYWNSMIHNQPVPKVIRGVIDDSSAENSASLEASPLGNSRESDEDFYSDNELSVAGDESFSKADLQKYLLLLFDWNWEMTPFEWNVYCRGKMPDMKKMCENCTRYEFFYNMNPNHMDVVMRVNRELKARKSAIEAIRLAACMRDDPAMNTNAWIRGLLMTMINGPMELRGLRTPSMVEVLPSTFLKVEQVNEAKRQARYVQADQRTCVPVNGHVGRDNGIENLLWYWREDVWLNAFHWYWHLTYPFMGQEVRGDRRGELLYYSHHSLCARYHAERLSVGLPTVEPIEIFPGLTEIETGYNPHLADANSGRIWTARRPGSLVRDIDNQVNGMPVTVDLQARVQQLLYINQAIEAGVALTPEGFKIPLRTFEGMDMLGDMLEASVYTVNQDLYGYPGPHNDAHISIGLIEDPLNEAGLPPGVMSDPSVAMRDPIFYRVHVQVDSIFDKYKRTLPAYQPTQGDFPLIFPGVQIVGVSLLPYGGIEPNKVETFFNERSYDLSRGLDFNRTVTNGPVPACVKHLDYQRFNYEIMIKRDKKSATSRATVRIFLAPRYNEHGRRYTMDEQRVLFFALDRFPVYLSPGLNKITRKSTESTLTVPFSQSYANVQTDLQNETPFCGCGWPEHLLLPRGNARGLEFDLFVMVTNGDEDAVPLVNKDKGQNGCQPAPIFCGIVGENYPDARPMGYPFDRKPYTVIEPLTSVRRLVASLEEYVIGIPNMGTVPIRIYHRGDDAESVLATSEVQQVFPVVIPQPQRQIVQTFPPLGQQLQQPQFFQPTVLDGGAAETVSGGVGGGAGVVRNCVPYKYRYLCYIQNQIRRRR